MSKLINGMNVLADLIKLCIDYNYREIKIDDFFSFVHDLNNEIFKDAYVTSTKDDVEYVINHSSKALSLKDDSIIQFKDSVETYRVMDTMYYSYFNEYKDEYLTAFDKHFSKQKKLDMYQINYNKGKKSLKYKFKGRTVNHDNYLYGSLVIDKNNWNYIVPIGRLVVSPYGSLHRDDNLPFNLLNWRVDPNTIEQFTGSYDNTKWEELSDFEQFCWLHTNKEIDEFNTKEDWIGKEIYENEEVLLEKDITIGVDSGDKDYCVHRVLDSKSYFAHEIKTYSSFFKEVVDGKKRFTIRKDDRNYRVGDVLIKIETDKGVPTGRKVYASITYKLNGGSYGVSDNYCILGFEVLDIIYGEEE